MDQTLLYAVAITALLISDLLLVALAILLYRRRQAASDTAATLQGVAQGLDGLRQELAQIGAASGLLNERLERVETQLKRLVERSGEQPLPARKEADHKAFEVASRLVSQGADVEELMKVCGLTRGEAELIRRLHGGAG